MNISFFNFCINLFCYYSRIFQKVQNILSYHLYCKFAVIESENFRTKSNSESFEKFSTMAAGVRPLLYRFSPNFPAYRPTIQICLNTNAKENSIEQSSIPRIPVGKRWKSIIKFARKFAAARHSFNLKLIKPRAEIDALNIIHSVVYLFINFACCSHGWILIWVVSDFLCNVYSGDWSACVISIWIRKFAGIFCEFVWVYGL